MPPGRKPKPPGQAVTRHKKTHEFVAAPGTGWQHGDPPEPDAEWHSKTKTAWTAWFQGWWASFWSLEDVPGLRLLGDKLDEVNRGALDHTKVVPLMDRYGVTPKGRQDLRWVEKGEQAQTASKSPDERRREMRAVL
jgi:hypothetical protein